jgi:hypothetical protein
MRMPFVFSSVPRVKSGQCRRQQLKLLTCTYGKDRYNPGKWMSWVAFRRSGCSIKVLHLFFLLPRRMWLNLSPLLLTYWSSPQEANRNEIGWELFLRWKRTQIYLTNQYSSPWLNSRISTQYAERTIAKIFRSENNQSSLQIKCPQQSSNIQITERKNWVA